MQNTDKIIVKVKTRKQIRDFINFPLKLYKDNPYFVPPLYSDELKLFKKSNVYAEQSTTVYYLCYQNGKVVGRISGIIQHVSNKKWNQNRIRFTRFDSIDDQEVANMLFNAVENFAKQNNISQICGPLGFSDLEREGLLIEGFDELSTYEEQYNYAYYPKLIENYGFEKEIDWVERKLYAPIDKTNRLEKISNYMLEKYNLKMVHSKSVRKLLKQYGNKIFDLLDLTYDSLYGTVPLSQKMKDMLISNFKLILNAKYVIFIVDEEDNVVCFGICLPSIAKAVQPSGGRLTIPCLIRLLKALKKPEIIDLALIGVDPKYKGRGVSTAILAKFSEYLASGNIKYAETNLNLEDNVNIINQWKNFENVLHKRRRSYIKEIK